MNTGVSLSYTHWLYKTIRKTGVFLKATPRYQNRPVSVVINNAGSAVGIAVDVGIAVASHAVAAIVGTDRVDFSIVVVGFAIGSRDF